jgi:hypothetical protein
MIQLSILIPTIPSRGSMFDSLLDEFFRQIDELNLSDFIHVFYYEDRFNNIGKARNLLLRNACGKYSLFFDDDDKPSSDFIKLIWQGVQSDCDVISLKGIYTVNGNNPEIFEHSLKYNSWKTNANVVYPNVKYERPPNHLNAIKTSISKQFLFKEINHGEDKFWSEELNASGLLKTEFIINEPIYNYLKVTK